ncbi:MAG: ThiF family adenylyltransferase [Spirochaetaceae bacterium]|nr:ThiF family adenylyltransferase [Spirochaetaceae bacterium]
MGRHDRDLIFSEEEKARLRASRVLVAGLGGLGGQVLELLLRLGVGSGPGGLLRALDPDRFEESNLNRQLLATRTSLGRPKAEAARGRAALVDADCRVEALEAALDSRNASAMLDGIDLAVDCLDSVEARLVLAEACAARGLKLVHGAVAGWYGQVAVLRPRRDSLARLYRQGAGPGLEAALGNPAFSPALVASLEACEAAKLLAGRESALAGRVLRLDLLEMEFEVFELG